MDKSGSSGSGSQSQSTSTPVISVLVKRKPQYIQTEEYYEDYYDDEENLDVEIGLEEIEEEIEEEEGEEDNVELDTQHIPSLATLASRVGQRKKSNRTKGPSPAWNDATKVNMTDEFANKTVMAECNHCKIQVPANVVIDDSLGLEDDVATRMQRKIQQKRAAAQQNEISNEVDMYFNDPHQSLTYEGFNILDWWKVNSGTYPTLSKVAKDIFALPSSTVASENAFSLGGRVVDPFRASLTPRTVKALVCTSDWLRGNEMSFYKEPTIDDLMFYKELEDLEKELPNMGMGGEENPTQSEMPPPPPPQVQRRSSLPPRPPISRASTPTQRRVQLSTRGRGPSSTPTSTGHSSTRGRGRRG